MTKGNKIFDSINNTMKEFVRPCYDMDAPLVLEAQSRVSMMLTSGLDSSSAVSCSLSDEWSAIS